VDGLQSVVDERRKTKVEFLGLSTGYPILDRQIDGLTPGGLHIVAARKKMGKSALLTNIAMHVGARLKTPLLYVDTEMSYGEWRNRAVAMISGVKERDFKHGGYDDATYAKLCKAVTLLDNTKIFHERMPGYSADKLVALFKKYKAKEGIGLMVFDYLKEPESSSIEGPRKEYQVLGDVTTRLKDLAGELDIPALTAVQLNRSNDVADSDRIARYADVVAFWMNRTKEEIDESGMESGLYKLVIKDSRRGGETGEHGIGYNFFKEYVEIKEVDITKQFFGQFDKGVVNVNSAGGYAGF
jgi:replicative DNA helicase